MEGLSEEEKKALRGSKFAPLPPPPSSSSYTSSEQPRLAHPGGPLKTNKAAALAKFLERKLQEPDGLASLDPRLIELAVHNAKSTLTHSSSSYGASTSGRVVRHVSSFDDSEDPFEEEKIDSAQQKKKKKEKKHKRKNKKNKKHKMVDDSECVKIKRPKTKLKL